ncbi:MAG: VanW family protein [Methylacidiphilales bacterium]|nr:VanW family protein [Candidatus Methylacidiphilales bacterium]NJR17828.1 VanW family protein [Calothrix sp. CSU_2_0]
MTQISINLKALIRQKIKDGNSILSGYTANYAKIQNLHNFSDYLYKWSEISTEIKKRSGFPQINENRLWNMQLAAKNIHGLILLPGQIFDFWNRIPRPTLANGYKEGPTLVGNKLINDVGGGLCQISTNVFQASLWANLEILERSNHSIDAHGEGRFFTLGQDATVAYGYKNLIARNQSQTALQLRLEILAEKSSVIASVWGTAPNTLSVNISSTILEKLPPLGNNRKPGWRVETVRSVGTETNPTSDWQINYRALDIYHPHV